MADTLVLLHGFGGTRRAWDPVLPYLDGQRYRPLALDLRGHGAAAGPVGFLGCVEDVLAAAPGTFALCGYSLGGRVALHVALAAPERVTRLVLVATSAGLEDPRERAARRDADARLAGALRTDTREGWVDRWMAQAVFAGTPPEAARPWREDLLRNAPARMAEALVALSPGAMTPLWDRLAELPMPATVVAGTRDEKYVALGERLASALPRAELLLVEGAGHGLPREAPRELAAAIDGRAAG